MSSVALDKKALWKDIERDIRKQQKETLARLQSEWKAARLNKRAALAAVRAQCKADRDAARSRIVAMRERMRAEYKQAAEAKRAEARGSCAASAQAVKRTWRKRRKR